MTDSPLEPPLSRYDRRRLGVEIWIVLGLSLGKSAVYAVANILERLSAPVALVTKTTRE